MDYQCIPLTEQWNEMFLVVGISRHRLYCKSIGLEFAFYLKFGLRMVSSLLHFPKLILWPPLFNEYPTSWGSPECKYMHILLAHACRACQQQWKLWTVGVVFYWSNNTLIYIYIFVQMFVLDKAYPNLIVGIDALDRLQHWFLSFLNNIASFNI